MFSDTSAQQTALQSAQRAIAAGVTDGELAALSRAPEVKVRAAVAEHAGTPLTTLLKLAQDAAVDVRIGVARNRRTGIPIEVHEDLAKDKSVDVVYALIDNPSVPESLIAKLGRHLHREYAKAARARLSESKSGTWAPAVEAAAEPAPAPTPAVPSFPAIQESTVARTPVTPMADRSRADALDILLGDKR